MHPKEYDILRRAVDDGLQAGLLRYYQNPASAGALIQGEDSLLKYYLMEGVVDEICRWFDFPEHLLSPEKTDDHP